jgi:chromosome partitioning protein
MNKLWTPNEIARIFRITKTKTSILRDEANNIIPKAERVNRGKSLVRVWNKVDLPAIGKIYGFLKPPNHTQIISIYTAKGGVLKTTLSYNLARILSLNGIKTLVIGLDVQCSITDLLTNQPEVGSIDEIIHLPGLYEAANTSTKDVFFINNIIQHSDLPTLDFIPESINLNFLEQKIRDEKKREYFITRLIEPIKNKYQVIIFDNAPSWNFLIQNSLVASNIVISPIGCDIGTYRSVSQNIGIINNYKKEMELHWSHFIIIPTLLEKTKISTQIEAQYKIMYPELITNTSIRRAVKGQESVLKNASIIETDPNSPLAYDYYETLIEVWGKILEEQA